MKKSIAILMIALLILGATACTTPTPTLAPATNPPAEATASPTPAATETIAPTEEPAASAEKDFGQIGSELLKTEMLGSLKLGMTEGELIAALGEPDSKSGFELWGADGLNHSDWVYEAKGLAINLAGEPDSDAELTVYSIGASAPCDLATQKGVKIGDSKEALVEAYGFAMEVQEEVDGRIVAGTVFGGLIFGIKDGKVSSIFIGASAE